MAGQKTLPFPPGSQYRYGMGDYFLLGVIVKRISRRSLAEFARERVFVPLGMSRTFFEEDPGAVVEQCAVGHYKRVGDAWHLWRPTAYWVGGAGLKTCVEDLCRWDQNFAHNRLPRGKYLDESSERARSWGIALSSIWMPPSRKSIPSAATKVAARPVSRAQCAGNSRVVRGASMPR